MSTLIAVYGTLKRGYGNNRWCLDGAEFVGEAITRKAYNLYNGGFPIAGTKDVGHRMLPIKVEVFKCSDEHVKSCDGLEGHPNWYRRELRPVTMDDGTVVDAWIYEMNDNVSRTSLCPIYSDVVEDKEVEYYKWGN